MSIFPEDNVIFDDVINDMTMEAEELAILKEYAWDFDLDDFILEDGKFKVVEGLEAIKIWIYKTLRTERYRYMVYSWDYGHEFDNLVGKNLSKEVMESEAKRLLDECLSVNPYILGISSLIAKMEKDIVNINATVNTIYGEVKVSV